MYGTFSGSPANSNLGDHQCKPKGHCKNQINQRKLPPPYLAAKYGNLHMFPNPTADPAVASTKPILLEKPPLSSFINL